MLGFRSNKEKLAKQLEKLKLLLNCHGVTHWPDRLNKSLDWIKKDDGRGVEEILSEFGSMGSLNDLRIFSYNGHLISTPSEEKSVNLKLESYGRKIYTLAKSLE